MGDRSEWVCVFCEKQNLIDASALVYVIDHYMAGVEYQRGMVGSASVAAISIDVSDPLTVAYTTQLATLEWVLGLIRECANAVEQEAATDDVGVTDTQQRP